MEKEVCKELRLPRLISDNMVLQRDEEIKLWGYIEAGAALTITFANKTYEAVGLESGRWEMTLPALEAGGPYEIVIKTKGGQGKEEILKIKNVVVGDLWLCGGQSNMELPIDRVMERYREEVNSYENPMIRMFRVPLKYEFNGPLEEVEEGMWQVLNKENVLEFNATGYFFAKKLFEKYQVPIGLVHTALGGTPAEAWISEKGLAKFPVYLEQAAKYRSEEYIQEVLDEDQKQISEWYGKLNEMDLGNKGDWVNPTCETKDWDRFEMPSFLDRKGLGLSKGGVVWFHKEVELSEEMAGQEARIVLGTVVDHDMVYINGQQVGETPYKYPPRIYSIPKGVLKAGKNTIMIRVVFSYGEIGFTADKTYAIETASGSVDLKGEWRYKVGATLEEMITQTFIQYKPTGVYNAMIAPLKNMKFKGVIWYQGESNEDRTKEYKELFETLIKDWRETLNSPELPFLYVQLPNFDGASSRFNEAKPISELESDKVQGTRPSSGWAEIRQAQFETLELPQTGMAVAIDIGEWNDLHPLNKGAVGERLVKLAMKIAYNEELVSSGPLVETAKLEGNKVILSFKEIGSGLIQKGEGLKTFIISEDGEYFYPANAEIQGDTVVVWQEQIKAPIEVRYAWADNPEGANLYNKEGLPASPFCVRVERA